MEKILELLPGAWLISTKKFEDERGVFIKTVAQSELKKLGVNIQVREEFISVSKKNVIRGMHFQLPPYDHAKLIYCVTGAVKDVLVDLRADGRGKVASVTLDSASPSILYIPKGVAHGFKSLADNSVMIYKTDCEYHPSHDTGILWNSIDYDWGESDAILSARDKSHVKLSEFKSPF